MSFSQVCPLPCFHLDSSTLLLFSVYTSVSSTHLLFGVCTSVSSTAQKNLECCVCGLCILVVYIWCCLDSNHRRLEPGNQRSILMHCVSQCRTLHRKSSKGRWSVRASASLCTSHSVLQCCKLPWLTLSLTYRGQIGKIKYILFLQFSSKKIRS